jgi:hypothetical protein
MQASLEEQQELASNRLNELQEMTDRNRSALHELETLRMNVRFN